MLSLYDNNQSDVIKAFNSTSRCLDMRGSRKFCQRGSNFDNVFLV